MLTLKAKYQVGDYVAVECGGRIAFFEVMGMEWNSDCLIIGRLNPSAVAKFRKPVVEEPPKKRGRKPKVAITMDTEPEQAEIPADAPD